MSIEAMARPKAKQPKPEPTGVRYDPAIKAAIERAAQDERRTFSSMAEKIAEDWLRERGYWPPKSGED